MQDNPKVPNFDWLLDGLNAIMTDKNDVILGRRKKRRNLGRPLEYHKGGDTAY